MKCMVALSLFVGVASTFTIHNVFERSKAEIPRLKDAASRIINLALNGPSQNQTYNRYMLFEITLRISKVIPVSFYTFR